MSTPSTFAADSSRMMYHHKKYIILTKRIQVVGHTVYALQCMFTCTVYTLPAHQAFRQMALHSTTMIKGLRAVVCPDWIDWEERLKLFSTGAKCWSEDDDNRLCIILANAIFQQYSSRIGMHNPRPATDLASERVLSDPRSRLKIQETAEWQRVYEWT